MDPIELSLFANRIQAICEEMGAVLRRTAFSPNIKDRLDFSCAVFDAGGALCAQAAHIPVHLGSMAFAMADIVSSREWLDGDMLILNDPYLGGTHLPDVTVIAPLYVDDSLAGFVANRAHHADIGCNRPGSMPLARSLHEEGLVISPSTFIRHGRIDERFMHWFLGHTRNPVAARGDLSAQVSANRCGLERASALVSRMGKSQYGTALAALNDYAEELASSALRDIPDGIYQFEDCLDDDGQGNLDIPIHVALTVRDGHVDVDFSGTSPQVEGNVNCPLSVAAASVYYVFHCLMPPQTPPCAGSFRPLSVNAPSGSLLNACAPAAVAAGNVETSTRVVDAVLGALARALPERIPAASHGSMNNVAMGADDWSYYETIGGGMGAGPDGGGLDAVQTHMTNTLNTPIEVVEMSFPLRISRYAVRRESGGRGKRRGGNGLIREFHFLEPTSITLISERRRRAPWGLAGGAPGRPGVNLMNHLPVAGKVSIDAARGDLLTVMTGGGGGWGTP